MKKYLLILLPLMLRVSMVSAQGCAVCSKNAEAYGEKGARGLNGGIMYLAFLPLAIMLTIGFRWWRSNKNTI